MQSKSEAPTTDFKRRVKVTNDPLNADNDPFAPPGDVKSEPPPPRNSKWPSSSMAASLGRSNIDPARLRGTQPPKSIQQINQEEGRSLSRVGFSEPNLDVVNSSRSIDLPSDSGSDSPPRESGLDSPLLPSPLNTQRGPPPQPKDKSQRPRRYRRPEHPPPLLEDKSNITENPDIDEIKSVIAELQLMEAKRQLSELKKTKIDEKTYHDFVTSLDKQGLKLDPGGVMTKPFVGKERPKTPTELLAGATIDYKSPIEEGELLKTIQQRKDTASTMELRDQIMKDTGREFGPDIALFIFLNDFKTDILQNETKINRIINENSSITEVLNVLAFLINKKNKRAESIISDFSVKGGSHDEKGKYINENDIKSNHNPDHIKTVFSCLKEGDESPFNIKTLQPYTADDSTTLPKGKLPPKIILPAGILKRKSDYTTQHFELTPEEIPKLFIACVLQMIKLLQTTREVFGNWAKLFKGMNGGGSKSKSKKTRRRNRNRN
jgi:hypothetical protein